MNRVSQYCGLNFSAPPPQQIKSGRSHTEARLLFSLGVLFSRRVIKEKVRAQASDRRSVERASGLIRTRISFPHLRKHSSPSGGSGRLQRPAAGRARRHVAANAATLGRIEEGPSPPLASEMMINHLGRRDLWKTSCAAH